MIRSSVALILFIIFVLGTASNVIILLSRKERPFAPLISGIAGAVSIWLSPFTEFRRYFWLPLVIDPGCAYAIICVFVVNTPYWYSTNRFFKIARLESFDDENQTTIITLYRSGSYILKMQRSQPYYLLSHIGEWSLDGDILKLVVGSKPVYYRNDGHTYLWEWQTHSEQSVLDGIDLVITNGKSLRARGYNHEQI